MNLRTPSTPPRLTNAELARRFRRIARFRAANHLSYYRVRAFYQAAHVVTSLPHNLEDEIRTGLDLTRHPCIGRKIARILRVMVKGEEFGQLEFPLRSGPDRKESAA